MYIIEVWEKKKYKELLSTRHASKTKLEEEVEDLNKLVPYEVLRFLPITKKYRVKKIKNGNSKKEEVT
jgi:hypothetical protein